MSTEASVPAAPANAASRRTGPLTARFAGARGVALLWFGVLAGPVAWAAHLTIVYILVPHACERGSRVGMHVTTAAAFALALAGLVVAWRSWGAAGRTTEGMDTGGVIARSRFMALGGGVLAAWFALVILGEAIPEFLVPPCR